jgi:hypothetical protein
MLLGSLLTELHHDKFTFSQPALLLNSSRFSRSFYGAVGVDVSDNVFKNSRIGMPVAGVSPRLPISVAAFMSACQIRFYM